MTNAVADKFNAGTRAFRTWLAAEPNRRLKYSHEEDEQTEALVSSEYVVGLVVECIRTRTPVVLSGPRGCGKTKCVLDAIEKAVDGRIVFGTAARRSSWGYVMAQGNKELPREYLMEDEARVGGVPGRVTLELKEAPLLMFAERDNDGAPLLHPDERLKLDSKHEAEGKPFVLFLDEINRFSDGVLDSLLLLLEEGQVIRNGRCIGLDCAVVMTMNPPGYDGTAKRLSPPLQARLGRVLQLCTPDFTTTYTISHKALDKQGIRLVANSDDDWSLKRACLASIALWGSIEKDTAAYRYLTPQTRDLLARLVDTHAPLRAPMALLAKQCSYGPDVRGVKFWFAAAYHRRAELLHSNADPRSSRKGLLEECLKDTFTQTMLHRLATRFVEATSAKELGQVEAAAKAVMEYVMMLQPVSDLAAWSPLRTAFDDLAPYAKKLLDMWGVTPETLRREWQNAGSASDKELVSFAEAITSAQYEKTASADRLEACVKALEQAGVVFKVRRLEGEVARMECYTRRPELPRLLSSGQDKGFMAGAEVKWIYSPLLFARPDDLEALLQDAYDAYACMADSVSSDPMAFVAAPTPEGVDLPRMDLLKRVVKQIDGLPNMDVAQRDLEIGGRYAVELIECNRRMQEYLQASILKQDREADDLSRFLAHLIAAWEAAEAANEPRSTMRIGSQRLDQRRRRELSRRLSPPAD